jgi:predicted membrane chloride channel (bestrophin family)
VYNPQELLLMGFLLTMHVSPQRAGDALWALANPSLGETVGCG